MLEQWDELRDYGPEDNTPVCPHCAQRDEVYLRGEHLMGYVVTESYACRRCNEQWFVDHCSICGHPAHEGKVCQVTDPDGDVCCCDATEQTSAMPDYSDKYDDLRSFDAQWTPDDLERYAAEFHTYGIGPTSYDNQIFVCGEEAVE